MEVVIREIKKEDALSAAFMATEWFGKLLKKTSPPGQRRS